MTRVSSVSPREASNKLGSLPRPESACTVVSRAMASRVIFWISPPTGGHRTEQTPELSRFSEHDANDMNNAAVASERSSIDEDFTTSFHVIGEAQMRAEAARRESTKLPFHRGCSSKFLYLARTR